jgi:glycosyltransferase involved in cell wall biosynthesis
MDVEFEYAKSLNNDELLSLRKSFGIGANCFLITYVGRLVPSKSLEDAMRVLKLVRNAGVDAYLMFVGEGLLKEEIRYKFYLENLIYTMGLASYVRFTGYQTDVFRFIKASDVIIMTSKYEGLPNIAVEAGICFKPFVAYNVCGLAEVIENGKTGYIVDQGDINRMSSILVYLFNNKDSVHKIGINARTKLELDYNLNKMIIDKLNFYEKINLINIL